MSKSFKFVGLIFVFLITSTYTFNPNHKSKSIFFPIKEVIIEGTKALDKQKIIIELNYLKGTGLIFINKKTIKTTLKKYEFIESFKIKKIYPNTIKFIFKEKEPIAIKSLGKNKFYITEDGEYIRFKKLDYFSNLPIIFGKKNNFNLLYKNLKNINFPTKKIKSYLSFDVGRWDIILKNGVVIKLPYINYLEGVNNFMSIYNKKEFSKFKVFDYRIKNQLILK